MQEIWKDIKGYEGLYRVSNFGNVKSLNYRHKNEERLLKLNVNKNGYCFVNLHIKGTAKNVLVHRLVAEAFIENPLNFPLVNHKDENKTNNNVENLEWCTQKYNLNYSLNKRNRKNNCKKNKIPHKYFREVIQIKPNGEVVEKYKNVSEAARLKRYDLKSLIDCCKGNRKTAYGFIWQYAD